VPNCSESFEKPATALNALDPGAPLCDSGFSFGKRARWNFTFQSEFRQKRRWP
jgi:hypothetical protein